MQGAAVANLAAAFRVELRLIEYQLIESFAFLAHFAVFDELHRCRFVVVTHKLGVGVGVYLLPVIGFDGGGCSGAVFLYLELLLEAGFVNRKAVLAGN